MKLYRTFQGAVAEGAGKFVKIASDWDALLIRDDLSAFVKQSLSSTSILDAEAIRAPLAPIGTQEVWAAGVT